MWSRDQIDKVRTSVDMVDTIREYVPSLTARGHSIKGLCPFHHEKTPSFHVHPEKGLFKCFGCGESGDIIGFFSKIESVGFVEAVERLAERAGIRLNQEVSSQQRQIESVREKLFRVLETAKNIYQDQLWTSGLGESTLLYLQNRGVSEKTAQEFQLGLAPDRNGSVFEALIKKGFSVDLCSQAGLVARSQAGKYYDPLFGRLVFPIFDGFGHVVGFGGRILPQEKRNILGLENENSHDAGPKYLNSPESPVFSKGKLLYGLNQAKPAILDKRRVVICEGYMDVIGVHQAGFKAAVATLGTAFTKDHAKLLKRYADEVVSFFDPDEAGKKAVLRGLEPMVQEDLFPRVVMADNDLDPDELIHKEGLEHFEQLIERAPDFVEYLVQVWGSSGDQSLRTKTQVAQKLMDYINMSPNEILKAEWLRKVAGGLSLTTDSLKKELKNSENVGFDKVPRSRNFLPTAEEEFLQLLINEPNVWSECRLVAGDFEEGPVRTLFLILKEQLDGQKKISMPAIFDQWPADKKNWLMQLAIEEKKFSNPIEHMNELSQSIRVKKDRKRLTQLSQIMARGEASVENQTEYRELLRHLKGSGRQAVQIEN